eukprot:Skav223301  [mRNA]  locus=scaffold4198:138017:140069:- [translate_table: standard]
MGKVFLGADQEKMKLKLHRPKKVKVGFEKSGQRGRCRSLGVKLDYTDSSKGVVVRDVGPSGKIPSWNADNKANAVTGGDRIVELNGEPKDGSAFVDGIGKVAASAWMELTVLKYTK